MENTEKQHLELITQMISIARKEYDDDSYIYLIWGWTVSIACLAQYVLMRMNKDYSGIVWLICIPLAIILQIVLMLRKRNSTRVKTHMDKIIGFVWIAVGVCIAAVLFSSDILQGNTYPVLILLYGIGTFISGSVMNFKPMKIGGICCWVIGLTAFRVTFEYQLLLLPLSLISSYIIPGYMLKARFKSNV